MFKKTALLAAAAAATLVAIPAAAQAQSGYYGSGYDRNYNNGYQTDRSGRTFTYDRYGNRIYVDNGRYSQNDRYAQNGRYAQSYGQSYGTQGGYYGRTQSNNHYGQQRCSSGTTGTIVGGALGALIGRQVAQGGSSYGYGYNRGGNGTTGMIVGGAVGALAGRAIEKGSDNCR